MNWKFLFHCFIYLNFITGFFSALYMVFVVYKIPGKFGPMGSDAKKVTHDFFMQRRIYALEAWIVFGFLALYFALNEGRI